MVTELGLPQPHGLFLGCRRVAWLKGGMRDKILLGRDIASSAWHLTTDVNGSLRSTNH